MLAPNEITPAQLLRIIGTPACPALIDVCLPDDFTAVPHVIPGALRHTHTDLPRLERRLSGRPAIVICQKGRKLSQGVVSALQSRGITAKYLSGGVIAWRDTGAPLAPVAAIPFNAAGETLWITRARPKIDRIACPWLIRRFVDLQAKVLLVAAAEAAAAADLFAATPFDIEGAEFSHDGALCTFDTMIARFGLSTPALLRLAPVIRAADTNAHDLNPVAAGLLALLVGLSRQYRNDHQQLEAGIALYRWARDGQDEGHDWPHARA